MEKVNFVVDLKAKDSVESIFMVKYIASMEARDGSSYLNIVLSDSTGEIEGRKWHGAEAVVSKISRGDYVLVKGKVNQFQNRLQVIIKEIGKADPESINKEDFVSKSSTEPEKMFEELTSYIESLDDVYIKDLVKSIIYEPEISRRLKLWQAGKSIHHSYEGGLLEHILSCTKLADTMSNLYKVNKNFVIAGTILHDLCKIYELTDGPLVEYTEEGKLIGHVVKSVELLDRFCSKVRNFPHQTKIHLKHILLSHHGEYEYGSPKIPQTSEALLVHHIDLIDSKMASFENAKKSDNNVGHWTNYVKHLDRIVFKGDLPTHSEYIKDDSEDSYVEKNKVQVESLKSSGVKKNTQKHEKVTNPTMSSLLKNFKVES